jgi:pyrimidine operon attenuation protein/uracil phosphoribosyltransferase
VELVERREVLDERGIDRALTRMAAEILERAGDPASLGLVGIRTRGVPLAARLSRKIQEIEGHAPVLGAVDITLYRDDVFAGLPHPVVGSTDIPFDVKDRIVLLVDDVLYTGRTVRAALDALMDIGRPRAVRLAVLCDRGGRELPIRADHVGVTVETGRDEVVKVSLREVDGVDRVAVRGVAR